MRIKLITCVSFARTLVSATARSKNIIHTELLEANLPNHKSDFACFNGMESELCKGNINLCNENCQDDSIALRVKLHAMVYSAEANGFNAVLILLDNRCSDYLSGIKANKIPIVIPRSLFCNNLSCGYHADNQRLSTYFKDLGSAGKNSLNSDLKDDGVISMIEKLNRIKSGNTLPAAELFEFWENLSEIEAKWFGWDFEKLGSDYLMFQKFVDGFWSYDEFIVLMPGDQLVIDSEIGNVALKKAD